MLTVIPLEEHKFREENVGVSRHGQETLTSEIYSEVHYFYCPLFVSLKHLDPLFACSHSDTMDGHRKSARRHVNESTRYF